MWGWFQITQEGAGRRWAECEGHISLSPVMMGEEVQKTRVCGRRQKRHETRQNELESKDRALLPGVRRGQEEEVSGGGGWSCAMLQGPKCGTGHSSIAHRCGFMGRR